MIGEDVAPTEARDPGRQSEDAGENTLDQRPRSTITPVIGEFHPAATLFPLMEESALAELAADIAANGLREPIWRHRGGRVIDGRNRLLACQKAGVECRHRTYERGDETIVPFVISKNLHRRHLTTAQRAAVAAEIANLARGTNQHRVKAPSIEGSSQAQAAELMGVSRASVERAVAVKRANPELHEKVKAGEMTAGEARAAVVAAAAPTPELAFEPDQGLDREDSADDAPRAETAPNDGDLALAAIKAVAGLKISGTAAGRDYEWTDDEVRMAAKAAKWLRMFARGVAQAQRREQNLARRPDDEILHRLVAESYRRRP